jgi:hypothetical protein
MQLRLTPHWFSANALAEINVLYLFFSWISDCTTWFFIHYVNF